MKSIKELLKEEKRREAILKKNQVTIDKNNKEVQLIISKAKIDLDPTQLDPIIEWIENMILWEQDSLRIRTIRAYSQFHNGRISGMQLTIDLLNTIKKNNHDKREPKNR